MKLESLLQYLDEYLAVGQYQDYPMALNGLQVDGPADVAVIAAAVDASQASIDAASEAADDALAYGQP